MARHARHLVASKLNEHGVGFNFVVLENIIAKGVREIGPQPGARHRRQRDLQPAIARLAGVAEINLLAVCTLNLKGNERVGDLELVQGHLQIQARPAHAPARFQPEDALRA